MGLVVIVAIKDRIIDELDLFVFTDIVLVLFLFCVLAFPHWWRVRSLPFPHVLAYQSVTESVVGLPTKLFKLLTRTSSIKWVTNRLIDNLQFFRRPYKLPGGHHVVDSLFLVRRGVYRVSLHLYILLNLLSIIKFPNFMGVWLRVISRSWLLLHRPTIEELAVR